MHILYNLNFSSGKSYIGQTVRKMNTRLAQHRQSALRGSSQYPVHCAWRKHGEPSVEIIGNFSSQDELHAAEIEAIKQHCTLSPYGYNVCHGGETSPSKSHLVAKKISEKAIGRKHQADAVKAIGEKSKELWKDSEYREKVSAGLKSSWNDERRAETSARAKSLWDLRKEAGWKVPDSTREKLKARVFSDETRKRMSESAKSRKRSPVKAETCDKISSVVAESWKDPAIKAKRAEAIRLAQKQRFANMTEAERTEFNEIRKRAGETRRLKAQKAKEE